jgi:hypothetical protein
MNLSGTGVKEILGVWNCGKTSASLSDAQLLLLLSGLNGREFHRKSKSFILAAAFTETTGCA